MSLAFFCFNRGLPLTLRSAFYPLLGKAVWGPFGHLIDIVAVLATLFGLAVSLGFGAEQIAGGLHYLFGVAVNNTTKIVLIVVIISIALASVVAGLDKGVKRLSELNMGLAAALWLFVLIAGPTLVVLSTIFSSVIDYVRYLPALNNWIGREDTAFLHGWSTFYWAWWISWSPFVGMFIARVSKGRTVRQFLAAVIFVPLIITVVWFTTFGEIAILQNENAIGQLANGVDDVSLVLFHMLENLPLASFMSFVAIILVLVFFITSSDSGSLVVDSITAGGKLHAPVPQRIFWATIEGLIAAVLLYGGGAQALQALQAGTVAAGLPFTLVLIVCCFSLWKGLSTDSRLLRDIERSERQKPTAE